MALLRQSTGYTRTFKMIDSADHFSKKTGLTCTVTISKAGAAFGAAAGTVSEVASGWYKIVLTTVDTNTLGDLSYYITAAGADDTDFVDQVSARGIDDLAYPATSGRSMVVDASGLVDANTVKIGPTGSGTAQTARDVGASVLLSTGTGTGQLDFTSGVVKANLAQILGTALTETAGLLAAGFKKFFNVATPTGTVNSIPDAVAGATGGLFIAGTNAATTVTTSLTTTFTGNLTGNVGGNVTGSVGSVAAGGIASTSFAANALDAVWSTATRVLTAATNLTTALATPTNITAGTITTVSGNVTGSVGSVVGAVGSVTGNVGGNVTGSVGSLATQAKADVNAEVVDVLAVDTYAEPGQGTPAATATLAAKINYLYKAWRNKKTQTSSTFSLFADDATTVDQKATVSDDGTTTTIGEVATGP